MQGAVRRDHYHFQIVELIQLGGRFSRGPRHPGQGFVEVKEVLKGNGIQNSPLWLNGQFFLCLEGRVDSAWPAAILRYSSGKLVDQFDRTMTNDVVDIARE